MNKKTKDFVTYYYPGAFLAEESTREIEYRDLEDTLNSNGAKSAYGFSFHSISYITIDGQKFKSEAFDKTGIFFIDGELLTLKQIKKKYPGNYTLIANMEGNRWKQIIKTNTGWFLQFGENDQIINR